MRNHSSRRRSLALALSVSLSLLATHPIDINRN